MVYKKRKFKVIAKLNIRNLTKEHQGLLEMNSKNAEFSVSFDQERNKPGGSFLPQFYQILHGFFGDMQEKLTPEGPVSQRHIKDLFHFAFR